MDEWQIALPLGSILVTVIGWYAVHQNQKKLFQVQAKIPREIQRVESFIRWLDEGFINEQLFCVSCISLLTSTNEDELQHYVSEIHKARLNCISWAVKDEFFKAYFRGVWMVDREFQNSLDIFIDSIGQVLTLEMQIFQNAINTGTTIGWSHEMPEPYALVRSSYNVLITKSENLIDRIIAEAST